MGVQKFLQKLDNVRQTRSGQWQASCPAHEDKNPSLSVAKENGKDGEEIPLLYCHAGCSNEEILSSVGMKWKDIYFGGNGQSGAPKSKSSSTVTEKYVYHDRNGNPVHRVLRTQDKQFKQQRHENGRWIWGLGDIQTLLYKLPNIVSAIERDDVIYVCEGEKDVDNLAEIGLTATTNPMGAGGWKSHYNKMLEDASVVILPDNDEQGKDHAETVASELEPIAKSVKILELPGLDKKEDVTDWLEAGGTRDKLEKLARDCEQVDSTIQFKDFYASPIAEYIVNQEEKQGKMWAYVADRGLIFHYDKAIGVWQPLKKEYLLQSIRSYLRQLDSEWDTTYRVNEVFAAMKGVLMSRTDPDNFDPSQSPELDHINLKNGMLNWRTGELKPHRADYYSQFQLPVEYNPDAEAPLWKKSMKEWVPDSETRAFLQEFVGYCLIPDTSMQKAVILYGTASNGKSTFLDTLVELFGPQNLSSITLQRLGSRFGTVRIEDKLVNVATDIDSTYMEETGIVKTIVGGDKTLAVERKFGASYDITPIVRLMFSANELPKVGDKTEAWYRRFELVEFPNKFEPGDPSFDPQLENKLEKELPGILNWAIEGLIRLKQEGRFSQSGPMKEAKGEYRVINDPVRAFIEECCRTGEDEWIPGKMLHRVFKAYCVEAGVKPVARKTFTTRLKQLGFGVKNKRFGGKVRRCYTGIDIIENQVPVPDSDFQNHVEFGTP